MAYRFERDRPVAEEVRRIAAEELASAAANLQLQEPGARDESVHEARKSLKKTRALLRLVRPGLGLVFDRENARLRDAGLALSEFRDAGAMIETFDQLREKYRDSLGQRTLSSVRRHLTAIRDANAGDASIETVLRKVAASLRRARARAIEWPLDGDGFAALGAGLERSYRNGRTAMRALADAGASDEQWHEWRKVAKHLWYHLRLLENTWTEPMQRFERELKDLEQLLGDDHNLSVFRERAAAEPRAYGAPRQLGMLFELIEEHSGYLRAKALHAGEGIYAEKPGHFRARTEGLWEAWQSPLKQKGA